VKIKNTYVLEIEKNLRRRDEQPYLWDRKNLCRGPFLCREEREQAYVVEKEMIRNYVVGCVCAVEIEQTYAAKAETLTSWR
jgi:hypothetical protein